MSVRIASYLVALGLLPSPALAAGTLLHVVDFEAPGDFTPGGTYPQVDSNIDTCEYEKSCTTDSAAIVESPEPVRAGKRALRVTFAQGDKQSTSGNRAEVKLAKQFAHEYDVSFWYGFSVLIPNEWQFSSSDHSNVFQIHAGSGPGSSPVVGIRVGNAGNWRITSERDGTPSNQTTDTLAEYPVEKGIWNDFVMHAVWSSQEDGVLEIWHNGKKVVDKQSWRTIHPDTETQKPTSSFYVKFGYYGLDTNRVLYHDELRVAKGTGDLSALVSPSGSSAPDGGSAQDGGGGADAGGAGGTSGAAGGSSGGAGGTSGSGGAAAAAGAGSGSGGAGASTSDEDSGCGCRTASRPRGHASLVLLLLAAGLAALRSRTASRRAPGRRGPRLERLTLLAAALVLSCGGSEDAGPSTGGKAGAAGAISTGGLGGTSMGGSSSDSGPASGGTSAVGGAGGGIATGGAPGTGGSGGTSSGAPTPKSQFVPKPVGKCPEFVGPEITLNPAQGPRVVKLWISDAAKTQDGPLVFNWHGWHGSPGPGGIDTTSREKLLAMGGMLVAPYIEASDADEYWDMDDVLLADEVVGCAIQKVGIDLRRVYSTGLSAGGRQSLLLAYQRSGYIAAIVTYSPGTSSGALISQDPENEFAAMISHGGSTEDAIFQQLAESYFDGLVKAGHFVTFCKHTLGHSAPAALRAVAFDFLLAHPFGTNPSPYAGGLPASYPSYCGFTK